MRYHADIFHPIRMPRGPVFDGPRLLGGEHKLNEALDSILLPAMLALLAAPRLRFWPDFRGGQRGRLRNFRFITNRPFPVDVYVWTPGYWPERRLSDYYWVPGTWVPRAPSLNIFWTAGILVDLKASYFCGIPAIGAPHVGFYGRA